jgi:DNA-binding transcriptional regulator YdaS (Cro superfamily)
MKLIDYINSRSSQTEFASLIHAPVVSVHQWAHKIRPVPVERCVVIEQKTNGEVTRQDLRPDDWQLIWPELVDIQPRDRRQSAKGASSLETLERIKSAQ